ncbi:MAG: hypothetical protein KAV01_02375 [Candidatus Lokiarchaeota archaeon]|nr:hypothetical protein [Candidatus Lokiarchaeota archaeon]
MNAQTGINQGNEEFLKEIKIRCPQCSKNKELKIPMKVINQSKQLTTISIPSNLCCEHSFQAFVDKNFIVRGYQKVDFEFSHMEFYESSEGSYDTENFTSKPIFQQIIQLLRDCVDDKEILGSGIFTVEGKVLYSSLPQTTLFNTIREFEVRSEQHLISLKKMYLELDNSEKFISTIISFNGLKFNLVLMFSFRTKFGMGNLHMRDLLKKIEKIN